MRKKLLVILLLVVLIVLVVTRCGGRKTNRTIRRTARALRSRAARRSCPRS